jgi:exosortase
LLTSVSKTSVDDVFPSVAEALRKKFVIAATAISVIAVAVAYRGVFDFWWRKWTEPESYYSHAFFVPIAAVFITWYNRRSLAVQPVRACGWGFLVAFAAVAMGSIGWLGASGSLMGLMLPAFLLGAILAVLGRAPAKGLAFPVLFLYFMCVLPRSAIAFLSVRAQLISTAGAAAWLHMGGVRAVQQGVDLTLDHVSVTVGSGCSGFRLLISLLMVATFLANMRRGPLAGRLSLVLVTIPLGILLNSVRVTLIALVGEHFGTKQMLMFHDWSAYPLLLIAAALLIVISRVFGCRRYREMPRG